MIFALNSIVVECAWMRKCEIDISTIDGRISELLRMVGFPKSSPMLMVQHKMQRVSYQVEETEMQSTAKLA